MAAEVEKIEANNAVNAVKSADQKVADIQADRLRKKEEANQKRLEKHPKMGKVDNIIANNWKKGVAFAATGGLSFLAGWVCHKAFGDKKTDDNTVDVVETDVETEVTEAPFDTEA